MEPQRSLPGTKKGSSWNQKGFSYGDSRKTLLEPFFLRVCDLGEITEHSICRSNVIWLFSVCVCVYVCVCVCMCVCLYIALPGLTEKNNGPHKGM
jgi:hypothetical protein